MNMTSAVNSPAPLADEKRSSSFGRNQNWSRLCALKPKLKPKDRASL